MPKSVCNPWIASSYNLLFVIPDDNCPTMFYTEIFSKTPPCRCYTDLIHITNYFANYITASRIRQSLIFHGVLVKQKESPSMEGSSSCCVFSIMAPASLLEIQRNPYLGLLLGERSLSSMDCGNTGCGSHTSLAHSQCRSHPHTYLRRCCWSKCTWDLVPSNSLWTRWWQVSSEAWLAQGRQRVYL